jgi:hypothetical protein
MIGRTHRDGQAADTVTVDVLFGCREHWDSLEKALEGARMVNQTLGASQKLLVADLTYPSEDEIRIWARRSERWKRSSTREE